MGRVEFDNDGFKPGLNAGFHKCAIVGALVEIKEEAKKLKLILELAFRIEGASRIQNNKFFYDIELNEEHEIKKCPAITILNMHLDLLKYNGGFNIKGEWESSDERILHSADEISSDLNMHIEKEFQVESRPDIMHFICYAYYKLNTATGKSYFTVFAFTLDEKDRVAKFTSLIQNKINSRIIVNTPYSPQNAVQEAPQAAQRPQASRRV